MLLSELLQPGLTLLPFDNDRYYPDVLISTCEFIELFDHARHFIPGLPKKRQDRRSTYELAYVVVTSFFHRSLGLVKLSVSSYPAALVPPLSVGEPTMHLA